MSTNTRNLMRPFIPSCMCFMNTTLIKLISLLPQKRSGRSGKASGSLYLSTESVCLRNNLIILTFFEENKYGNIVIGSISDVCVCLSIMLSLPQRFNRNSPNLVVMFITWHQGARAVPYLDTPPGVGVKRSNSRKMQLRAHF